MKKVFVSVLALLAAVAVSAQDVATLFNEAAAAYNAKDFATAAAKFEQVIDEGADVEGAETQVESAKKNILVCYQNLGGRAAGAKQYDEAIAHLTKGVELADLYGDMQRKAKLNVVLSKVYQVQGGTAFNSKDYATASAIFQKGYDANPNNTAMALNLAMSYCEMFMASGNMDEYEKGMDVYEAVAAKTNPKFAEDAATAKEQIAYYINNMVAKLQSTGDHDGIIAATEKILAKNPENATAQKARLQAYADKKDYAKVIELGEAAAAVQVDEEDRSQVYFLLGAAYNAKEMKPQAIAAFQKVTAGSNVENAKAALAGLAK